MGISVEFENKTYRFIVLGDVKFWIDEQNIAVSSDDLMNTLNDLAAERVDPDTFLQAKVESVVKPSGVKKKKKKNSVIAGGQTLASIVADHVVME